MTTVLGALLSAIIWGLVTWWLGLPSSSSHALIGGLCGAALGTAARNQLERPAWSTGLWPKVVMPMVLSPLAGFAGGAILMFILTAILRKEMADARQVVNLVAGKLACSCCRASLELIMAPTVQKTMSIISIALFTGTSQGAFKDLPGVAGCADRRVHHSVLVRCSPAH